MRNVKITKGICGEIMQTSSPLWKVATTHVARKTFITICLSKGIPIQDVMRMSGHADYKSMKPYILKSAGSILRIQRTDVKYRVNSRIHAGRRLTELIY